MKKKLRNYQSLDSYINEALYHKKNGYYFRKDPFGNTGDYTTSPNISILFSEMVAIWIVLFWKFKKSPKEFNLIELGSGNGEMAYQILKTIERFPEFKKSVNFYIYERSELLIKIQKNKLKNFKVKWIKNFKKIKDTNNIFFGNEFMDAFAIKQFEKIKNNWFEKYVLEEGSKRKIVNIKKNIVEINKFFGFDVSINQKFIEAPIDLIILLKEISSLLKKTGGGLLLFDYGYTNNKMFNSIQSVQNHKKSNFLKAKGKNDITHLVNFHLIKQLFQKFGMSVNGPVTQKYFLSQMGIFERAEIISKNLTFKEKTNIYYRLKRLTDKKQMGELFKVIFASDKLSKFNIGF